MKVNDNPSETEAIRELSALTPFSPDDLRGQTFARGNMLGGANPLESAAPAPWQKNSNQG